MAITNLTNTRWYLNDTLAPMGEYQAPDVGDAGYFTYYQINFTSNDIEFKQLGCVICEDSAWGVEEEKGELQYFYVTMPESDPYEYPYDYLNSEWNWWGEPYRTITITGGEDAENAELIAWLAANATQLSIEDEDDPEEPDDPPESEVTKPSATFDLSTLNLPAGTYTIYVTLSAEGYRDSEPSNVVEYKITEEVEEITPYLTFSSPSSFTLKTNNSYKNWDGTLEYSTDTSTWDVWDGKTTLSADDGKLYLRGTGNTKITGAATYVYPQKYWILTGENISCDGNIETLLDYETVINGQHPIMSDYCYTLLFSKCAGLISAPELPATTLTQYCYSYMFDGCTGLTTIPALPATTLANYCYYYMFNNCTNIKISTTQTSEYNHEYRIPTNGTGTTANQALYFMFSSTGGTFTGAPEINTTYYTSNEIIPA